MGELTAQHRLTQPRLQCLQQMAPPCGKQDNSTCHSEWRSDGVKWQSDENGNWTLGLPKTDCMYDGVQLE